MSDLDDYRRFSITISGFRSSHEAGIIAAGFDEFRLYADRAIAELEADLADCAKTCGGLEYRLKQAEATIERLKNTIDLCSGPCSYAERSTP